MAVTVILISKTVDCDQSHLTVSIILLEVLQLKVTDTGLRGTLITHGRNCSYRKFLGSMGTKIF